jgi:hypothetical protein
MKTLTIYSPKEFLAKFAVMQRKARKLGLPVPTARPLGKPREETRVATVQVGDPRFNAEFKQTETVTVQEFEIDAPAFQIDGWQLVARLEPLGNTNVVIAIGDRAIDYSRHQHTGTACEHCNTERRRSFAYVLADAAGDTKQVGKSCLSLFFPNHPGNIAAAFEFQEQIFRFISDSANREEGFEGGTKQDSASALLVVQASIQAIRKFGYCSRQKAEEQQRQSTADTVAEMIYKHKVDHDSDGAEAAALIAWFQAQPAESDFSRAVNAYLAAGYCPMRRLGFLCAIKPGFDRSQAKAATDAAAAVSQHVGTIGQRQDFTATVASVRSFEGNYGVGFVTTATDAAGNLLKYWNAFADAEPGDTVEFSAAIKAHEQDRYNSAPVTVLSRATKIRVHRATAAA